MQAQADLLQCPVIIDPVPEATALGAAAMAAGDPERLFGGECEGIHQVGAALHHRRPGALIIPPRIGRDEAAARRRAWRRAVYGRDGAPAAFGS
jgi:glycerol kinase